MSNWEPQRLQDWHRRTIDLLIADPTLTNEQLEVHLNYNIGAAAIGLLRRTEMFRLALEERQGAISREVDKHTVDRINGKLGALAELALDTVTSQLGKEHAEGRVGVTEASLQTCEMVIKAFGYGRPATPSQPGQVNNFTLNVTANDVAQAQQLMRAAHARAIDVEPTAALPSPLAVRAG